LLSPLSSAFVFNLHDAALPASEHATHPLFSVCKPDCYADQQPTPPPTPSSTVSNIMEESTPPPPLQPTHAHIHAPPPGVAKSDDWAFFHSKDLIVPWHFSLRFQTQYFWFWPFYSYGPLFAKRNDIITWRGSTTSPWMTGPRFELTRRFGGKKIHPLKDELTNATEPQVDADFAFIKVVQTPPGAEGLSKQKCRFSKRHQFYKQMQKYKYVLDVDGNGALVSMSMHAGPVFF